MRTNPSSSRFVASLLGLAICCAPALTVAATSTGTTGSSSTPGTPPAGGNSAVDTALSACASSVTKDSSGKPDQAAMTACMTNKGFTRPAGGPGGPGGQGGAGGPPPGGGRH